MRIDDLTLLVRKILIGILLTIVPLLILLGGLRLTQKALTKTTTTEQSAGIAK